LFKNQSKKIISKNIFSIYCFNIFVSNLRPVTITAFSGRFCMEEKNVKKDV